MNFHPIPNHILVTPPLYLTHQMVHVSLYYDGTRGIHTWHSHVLSELGGTGIAVVGLAGRYAHFGSTRGGVARARATASSACRISFAAQIPMSRGTFTDSTLRSLPSGAAVSLLLRR